MAGAPSHILRTRQIDSFFIAFQPRAEKVVARRSSRIRPVNLLNMDLILDFPGRSIGLRNPICTLYLYHSPFSSVLLGNLAWYPNVSIACMNILEPR